METPIRTLRKQHGVTQLWMAEQLGLDRSTYFNYEKGKTRAPKSVLFHAAHLLHVPPEQLIHGTNR
ncbi:hypothetical protein A2529_05020 [Candidatus Peribacteria bacterium RIFOXYD2_FULL_58_15]|nr:MAG: hypothetical protein A2529_05020 [Candidatus Peribacteria bacterium RIFOXYD2_FULL_58_15]